MTENETESLKQRIDRIENEIMTLDIRLNEIRRLKQMKVDELKELTTN